MSDNSIGTSATGGNAVAMGNGTTASGEVVQLQWEVAQ